MTSTTSKLDWAFMAAKTAILIYAVVLIVHAQQKPKSHPVIPVLDCRESWVQAGVRVLRLSDHRLTRIDICGAADSSDDGFRDIPYEAPN